MELGRLSSLALLALLPATARAADGRVSERVPIETCESVSLAGPGFGVAYRGTIRNDDYGLSIVIPPGFTGWGAAEVAPFHGFTIFLREKGKLSSCINFEIHLRVDLGESESANSEEHRPAVRARIGNLMGWKEERTGAIDGVVFKNVIIEFSVPRDGGEVNDGSVSFITPADSFGETYPVFKRFVSHIRFRVPRSPKARRPGEGPSSRSSSNH